MTCLGCYFAPAHVEICPHNNDLFHINSPNIPLKKLSDGQNQKIKLYLGITDAEGNVIKNISKTDFNVFESTDVNNFKKIKSIDDLLKATLIGSSNDATETLANYFSNGNRQEFVKEMNIKAKEIGMKNTVFTNASGFDINNNVSTAEDLLKLAEYAYKIPYIQQTSNQKYVIFQIISLSVKYPKAFILFI